MARERLPPARASTRDDQQPGTRGHVRTPRSQAVIYSFACVLQLGDEPDRWVAADQPGPGCDSARGCQHATATGFRCRAIGRSDDVNVVGLRPLLALAGLEGDSLALLQRFEPAATNSRVVHEDVIAAAVRGDESVALLAVEPLHGALRHVPSTVQSGADRPTRRGKDADLTSWHHGGPHGDAEPWTAGPR